MNSAVLLERFLVRTLRAAGEGAPPRLAAAIQHAVFPAGARIRPRLCLAVARACGQELAPAAMAAAASIELLHCASLVHDDLPCFDDASTRRGRSSVHRAHGERAAVLAGDALIVLSTRMLVQQRLIPCDQRMALLSIVTEAAGVPNGIAAGQAWECEPSVELAPYQRFKTGALFAAACACGAIAGGAADVVPWREVGEMVGEAYQVADDICDVSADAITLGKPTGRDAALGRPNAVAELGMARAQLRLRQLVEASMARIPECPGAGELRARFQQAVEQIVASRLSRPAA
jgi:geranylgeranyl diphosphate synthase type II